MATTLWTVLSPCSCLGCVITGQIGRLAPAQPDPRGCAAGLGWDPVMCIFFSLFGHVCFIFFLKIYLFRPCCAARGISVPQPGTEPVPPAVEALSPNHRTARGVPVMCIVIKFFTTSNIYQNSYQLLTDKVKNG